MRPHWCRTDSVLYLVLTADIGVVAGLGVGLGWAWAIVVAVAAAAFTGFVVSRLMFGTYPADDS